MAKSEKKSSIQRPTDAEVFASTKGHPFDRCASCGNVKAPGAAYCPECKRLVELGMKTAVKQHLEANPAQDPQEPQSYPASRHDGFSTTAPKGKFPPTKERM